MSDQDKKFIRQDISAEFPRILKGKVVIVGVGNILRGDDAFGPALIERVKGNINAVCIDAGSTPENYVGKIAKEKPDTVIIADAAHLDQPAGVCEILKKEEIVKSGFTTHDLSPVMFIEYLEQETKADIYMLAVQPENTGFGEDMSDRVKKAIEEIVEELTGGTGNQ
ncbi:MAG: hydrogenase 3 maturation endopeptidase HyCI [Candidatus Omnitrophica bacterium]|nr:hydrogenase 3 maturation endopeptidase HyCI [Candidatus Omnitrophota bacterium]